jgi:glyoxylase-like metal-dependent hydrolase (beta-lactamase superfamily II)
MQLIQDIYLVSGFAYGLHPNVYAVKGDGAMVLIDTGLDGNDLSVIDETLHTWGLDQLPISHVLITHAHFDHTGNASILRRRGAQIVAGPGDAEGIEQGDDRTIPYAYGRKFPACPVDLRVKEGDLVHAAGLDFQVIHMPGHSGGSVFYRLVHQGRVVLFTGDTLHMGHNCETALLGWTGGIDYDRQAYLQSLSRCARLEADVILAGHYQPCLKDGYKVLQKAYALALVELRRP